MIAILNLIKGDIKMTNIYDQDDFFEGYKQKEIMH